MTGAHANYWTAFFPAFLVLGLGMAISIAPLTTVVMNSVEGERVGVASGINNAVARVAGVLAIAILGALMAGAFGHSLQHALSNLQLNADVIHHLESNAARLGSLDPPANVDPSTATAIRGAIETSFISGFRLVMLLCAGLAATSAAISAIKIRSQS
jgi:hypothetical protein